MALVAAAAIALLVVSAVVAFGGWQDDVDQSADRPALVFDGTTPADSVAAAAPARNATSRRTLVIAAVRPPRRQAEPKAAEAVVLDSSDIGIPGGEETTAPTVIAEPELDPPVSPPPPPPAAQPAPRTGDGVRDIGEDLSATVQNTGQALADATAPLAPPVSAAVQELLNIVAALLRRGTGALGNTLDGVAGGR